MLDVDERGPFFRPGAYEAGVRDALQLSVDAVAREGKNMVVGHLVTFIKRPTPYYWTQVEVEPVRPFVSRVWDQMVIYGPWLEGVSERNKTTRFKGYAAFRYSTQRLRARVPEIVQPIVGDFVRVMNG